VNRKFPAGSVKMTTICLIRGVRLISGNYDIVYDVDVIDQVKY